MARKFKYVGPHDEVEISLGDTVHGTVQRGHQIEIEDPEVSKGLDGSPDWEPIKDPARKRAAKKAAAKKAAASPPPAAPDETPAPAADDTPED